MKKFLACLLVFVFVVAGIFADPAPKSSEQHNLTITAQIAEVVPVFQLKLGSTATNTTPNNFDNATTSYSVDASSEANGTIDLSGTGTVAVNVIAYLANAAKTSRDFVLAFSGGTFATVTSNKESTPVAPTIDTAKGTNNGFVVTGDGEGDASVDVDFNAKTCTVGTIVTATYTYDRSDEYDPGTYTTDIILTVTAH